jgi:hypothetical protein
MTKKDYIKLAEVIARNTDISDTFMVDLCNMLYMDNTMFNTETFLKACKKYNN